MATLIRTDGELQQVEPENLKDGFQLEQLYRILDCDTIEVVRLGNGNILIIDEEGKLKEDHALNVRATTVARFHGAIEPRDYIAGHALLCKDKELK